MGARIAVLGATGRMGRLVIEELAAHPELSLVAAVGRLTAAEERAVGRVPVTGVGPGCFEPADVVIDFSLPDALRAAIPHLGRRGLVSGTTGLDSALEQSLQAQAARGPVLWAANFSIGVHVLRGLVRRAVIALPDADVEIVEVHHRAKRDAPSGTALSLAREVAAARGASLDQALRHGREGVTGPRPAAQIGMHAVRGGDVAGEHVVHLLADGERLTLGHSASGRGTFARGAVQAAAWIVGRAPGAYTLSDVLGSG